MGKSAAAAAALKDARAQLDDALREISQKRQKPSKEPAVAPPSAPTKSEVQRAPLTELPKEKIEPEISLEFLQKMLTDCQASGPLGP